MQVEWKWCNKLSRDNLKHELYTAHNLWEEAPLLSLYILCASSQGLHPNVIFPWDSYCPKTLDAHIFIKSSSFLECKKNFL
jgi:hypothetical protein